MATAARRLKHARRKRSHISSTLKRLGNGQLTLTVLLDDPPAHLGSVRIYTLLLKAPNMGESGVKRVLEKSGIYAAARVGTLTYEERHRVIRALPPRAKMI